jgi:uncharacterized protein (TIGR03067 family)
MRPIAFLSVLIISFGCTSSKTTMHKPGSLNGTWLPIKQEMGGKLLPEASFQNQQLIIKDSTYTFTAENTDKGLVRYREDKMDIFGKEGVNAGKHFTAIYKFENGQLTICYNLKGDGYPATFATQGYPLYFLSVFKKN